MTAPPRTFTQQQVNAILAQERRRIEAKYEGYDSFKAKADQYAALLATAGVDESNAGSGGIGGDTVEDAAGAAPTDADADAITSPPEDSDAPQDEVPGGDDLCEGSEAGRGVLESPVSQSDDLQVQLLRQQIAAKQGLDPDLWDRVVGSSPDEIAADVAKLVGKVGATHAQRPPRTVRGQSGASIADYRTPKEKALSALRGMSRG